jgi:3-oxoacyl-[acyl-carrier protein] reductase
VKRALVTGGSGAIGAAICRRLGADGYYVIVHSNARLDQAAAIATGITASGGSAQAIAFDVTDRAGTAVSLAELLEAGPIQAIVNNAATHDDAAMPGMSGDQWDRVLDVSLNGFFNVTQPLLMPMISTRWGRIVNMSSIAALAGNRGQTNYAAAKAGLHGATRSLAKELGGRGITVNCVAPGIIDTPMTAQAFSKQTIEKLVPMKRAGTADEVADLVSFLASERAAYISGQIIAIDGAMY